MDLKKILVKKYKSVIVRILTPSDVLPHLITLDKIQAVSGYIQTKERSSKTEAAHILVDNLIMSEEPGWYQQFLDSLKAKGYDLLSRTLEGHCDVKNPLMLEKLLTLYYVNICDHVQAVELLPYLVQYDTLKREDVDRIKAEMGSIGNHRAVLTLLDLVVRKRESWFADLMMALTECGYDYIVKDIDPDLVKLAKEHDAVGLQAFINQVANDQSSEIAKVEDCNNHKTDANTQENQETPSCCRVITTNYSFILDHIKGVDKIAERLREENLLEGIKYNSIMQNLKERGQTSAADELLEFVYRELDQAHHTTLYRILEETGHQELVEFLRKRTSESACSGDRREEPCDNRDSVTLANPDHLTDSTIAEELTDGKSPVHVTVGFASESIIRVLEGCDVITFLRELQRKSIIDLSEQVDLIQILRRDREWVCILKLNSYLQKKSKIKLNKVINVLREWPNAHGLASLIAVILLKCEEVFNENYCYSGCVPSEPGCLVPVRLKMKFPGLGRTGDILKKMKEMPDHWLNDLYIKAEVTDMKKGCIEINLKVKNHWELENLRKSVASGLFSQRYRLWLKKQGIEHRSKLETTLTMGTCYDPEPQHTVFEKCMAHHQEEVDEFSTSDGTSREMYFPERQQGEAPDPKINVTLANPDELTRDDIIGELAEGRSPVYITLAYVSDSIVKTLDRTDLTTLITNLEKKLIIDRAEVRQLTTFIQDSSMDRVDCILQLNVMLQRKTELQIIEFVRVLKANQKTNKLGYLVDAVLEKCQDLETEIQEKKDVSKILEVLQTEPCSSEAEMNRGVMGPNQQEPTDTNRGVESEPLVLRPYQQELAEEAVKGNNSIIVAPTGSGKTHVALYISQQHVEKSEAAEEAKIVFVVPTVALVSQQLAQYRKYLPQLKCVGLQGDSDESLHLRLPIYDVFVLTPQILLNALQSRDVTTLAEFTLLIFDECHHTSKNHPYNGIMHCYFQEKKEGKAHLPQVVGLTASVGVGKTNNIDRAVDHILKMCANLDSRLKTVQCHKESLQKHVNTPDENAIEVQSRKDHPFNTMIMRFMTDIEKYMKDLPEIQQVKEVADFRSQLTAPSEKGSDPYTGWVSGLKRPVARIYDQKVRRVFVACLKHLKIYNDALFVNSDCRTVDAWNYIKKEVGEFSDAATYKDETDKWLENIFYNDKVQMQLGRICEDKANENPKLKKVKEILLESHKDKNQDLRGIVFCKTREMTQALKNWMNEDNELMVLNPERLVSSHSAQERGGMTASGQIDVIQLFRDGKHKVIIATTVAEEGLDIRKCNLVLQYQHVTNETARIQAKGRGRDKDAKYMVVAERERIEKEETNRAREKLMHQAIAALLKKPEAEIEEQIRSIQVEEQLKQKHEEVAKIAQQALRQKSRDIENEYELRCFKCDKLACFSSDIKHVENSLHMVVSSDFDTFIDKEPHPKPVRIQGGAQMQEKIYCKECHTDWGITATYQDITYPIIKISAFIVIPPNGCRDTYKKWVKVPFKVEKLTLEDREIMTDNLKK